MRLICFVVFIASFVRRSSESDVMLELSRSKRQTISSMSCGELACEQQGSECIEVDGRPKCVCIAACDQPVSRDEFVCASNGFTYFSRCFMDMAACGQNTTLYEITCRSVATAEPAVPAEGREPVVSSVPGPVVVMSGEAATLTCRVTGYPQPTIFWKRRERIGFIDHGDPTDRVHLNDGSLVITRTQTSDSGVYICVAANRLGSVNVDFYLNVKGRVWAPAENSGTYTREERCLTSPSVQAQQCRVPISNRVIRGYWIYNRATNRCEMKYLKDCDRIVNKYRDRNSCERSCMNICELPPKQGPCHTFSTRVYYNSVTGNCEAFIYGGCQGNYNNFPNVAACREQCPLSGNAPVRSSTCPACFMESAMSYCRSSFVVMARVKRIVTIPGETYPLAQLHLTRYFKDDSIGLGLVNLDDPGQAYREMELDVNTTCPCPDIKSILLGKSRDSERRQEFCSQKALREGSPLCKELIISGVMRYGMPVITQNSYVAEATPTNIDRMEANKRHPGLCSLLRNLNGRQ